MTKSAKKHAILASFKVPMKVEIRAPEFEPLSSLSLLDTGRLSRGSHKIEIGFVKAGGCRSLVHAVIRGGLVTGCEIEPCKGTGSRPPPAEFRRALEKARKKILAGKEWKPIPIAEFVRSAARLGSLIIIVGGGCIFICIWNHCLLCCWRPFPHCFVPDIVVGPL
jgi:hypothetical protein